MNFIFYSQLYEKYTNFSTSQNRSIFGKNLRIMDGFWRCQNAFFPTVIAILFAGGIFVFPLLAPALMEHLKLTQPQLSSIALAGMAGQYPFSSIVGKLIDRYGPRVCSFLAAIMFSAAFGLSALEVSLSSARSSLPNTAVAERLTVYFAMAGLGTVLSYFSFLPHYRFWHHNVNVWPISSIFLSYVAGRFFSDTSTGSLDVTRFLLFLAISTGIVHLAGALVLTVPSTTTSPSSSTLETDSISNERSRLLDRGQSPHCTSDPRDSSALELLRDSNFWLLALYMVMILGVCEMIMSNVGTIALSLPAGMARTLVSKGEQAASLQVKILSISNTLSRLLVGPLADFVSPVFSYRLLEGFATIRKHRISRVVFLSGAASLLAASCAWMVFGVRTRHDVWLLSVGTGITYGAVFTVLPGITCSIWGIRNLARNFGIITYSPFVGTTFYSYVYALIVARHSPIGMACQGRICWQSTFYFCLGTSFTALAITAILWRKWSGKT
ncbi:major facilitator superfamily domain-containing protein [Lentinula lateritia]|uniref:Major facilitator superfamily domain-containing protein n=1 Tax=Lentinula lateritia TaxID=40482 RepID=A0ABQ8VJ45_9AGAR|nr:major facilitator superfamily domain-containing protein [Lentinula lateritia]